MHPVDNNNGDDDEDDDDDNLKKSRIPFYLELSTQKQMLVTIIILTWGGAIQKGSKVSATLQAFSTTFSEQ